MIILTIHYVVIRLDHVCGDTDSLWTSVLRNNNWW